MGKKSYIQQMFPILKTRPIAIWTTQLHKTVVFFSKVDEAFAQQKCSFFSISVYWRLIVIQALSHAFLHHHFLQPCNTVQVVSNSA